MTHWEKVNRLLDLVDALKQVTYYINQQPPKFDVPFWRDAHKRLTDRIVDLEEYIFTKDLDIPEYYEMERVRQQTIDFLESQGVFRYDNVIYDKD